MGFLEIEERKQTLVFNMTEHQFHDYYEIYFLTEGSRDFFIENKLYRITAPSLCVIPPFKMHKTEGGAYQRINVYISDKFLREDEKAFLSHLGELSVFSLQPNEIDFITTLLKEANTIDYRSAEHKKIVQVNFVKTIIYYLESKKLSPIQSTAKMPMKAFLKLLHTLTKIIVNTSR